MTWTFFLRCLKGDHLNWSGIFLSAYSTFQHCVFAATASACLTLPTPQHSVINTYLCQFCRCWLWCLSGSLWTVSSQRENWAGWMTSCQRARRRSLRMLKRYGCYDPCTFPNTTCRHNFIKIHMHLNSIFRRRNRVYWQKTREWCKCH